MPNANSYVKFSEIAISDLVNYLRLPETTQADETLLGTILEAAKSFVLTYTGRDETSADLFPEFTIAVYAIAEELFDKRTFTVDTNTANEIIASILGSRSINLL